MLLAGEANKLRSIFKDKRVEPNCQERTIRAGALMILMKVQVEYESNYC